MIIGLMVSGLSYFMALYKFRSIFSNQYGDGNFDEIWFVSIIYGIGFKFGLLIFVACAIFMLSRFFIKTFRARVLRCSKEEK